MEHSIKANASNKNTVTEEILDLAQKLIDDVYNSRITKMMKNMVKMNGVKIVSPKMTLKKKIKELVKASQEKAKEEKKGNPRS